MKCFLSEGVANGHALFFGGMESDSETFINNLPAVEEAKSSDKTSKQPEDHLQIAWRYKNQMNVQEEKKTKYHFNMHKTVTKDMLDKCLSVDVWTINDCDKEDQYREMFDKIRTILTSENRFSAGIGANKDHKNMLRIALQNIGSLSWANENVDKTKLTRFLMSLKSLVRNHLTVCLASASLSELGSAAAHVQECFDYVIQVKTFDAKLKSSGGIFNEKHGFLQVVKAAGFNALVTPVSMEKFVFRSTRTKFGIERIHLPPTDVEPEKVKGQEKSKSIDF